VNGKKTGQTMSKNKSKGTAFETLIVDYLKQFYPNCERRALQGALDKGDITGVDNRLIFECKSHNTLNFSGWLKEAEVERVNAGAEVGVVVAKRRGYGKAEDQYVVLTVKDLVKLLNITEF
jgi:hypothetical protein